MTAKILLFGKDGQVGWELQRSLFHLGDLVAVGRRDEGGLFCDMRQLDKIRLICKKFNPDVIVNAAAFTDVDRAESLKEDAMVINSIAPGILAEEAARIGSLFVHYSSDYVFDGSGESPWCETDLVNPQNCYGHSKSLGERSILDSGCRCLLIRTSWVYGHCGKNFPKTILKAASHRTELRVVDDQVGAPTSASSLADVTALLLRKVWSSRSFREVIHVAAKGEASWYDYAKYVLVEAERLGWPLVIKQLVPVNSEDFETKATRPKNSRLSLNKLQSDFGITMPEWQLGVSRFVREMCDANSVAIYK